LACTIESVTVKKLRDPYNTALPDQYDETDVKEQFNMETLVMEKTTTKTLYCVDSRR